MRGYRRFTYHLDRPDVMSKFTSVRLEADEVKCPILLLGAVDLSIVRQSSLLRQGIRF